MNMEDTTNTVSLKPISTQQNKRNIKYHLFFVLLILVFGLFIYALSIYGNNALPFGLFTLFFLVPVLIVFSDQLQDILPTALVNVLTTDAKPKNNVPKAAFFSSDGKISRKNKQYLLIGAVVVCIILSLYLGSIIYNNVKPDGTIGVKENTLLYLLSTIGLCFLSFIMTLNFYEISVPNRN